VAERQPYPCPECGFDGPHTTCEVDEGGVTYECGACYVEFYAPENADLNLPKEEVCSLTDCPGYLPPQIDDRRTT
jgi:hypothetical protein